MTSLDMPGRSGGSRAARMAERGDPISQGLICKCVQAFLFHFTKFIHVIIFSTKARRNSMKYDLFVYQRKTLIVVVPPTKLDRHA